MLYRYELHCHTKGVSRCGKVLPEEGAELYYKEGYQGVVVTDHMNSDTFPDKWADAPWEDKMERFLSGYRRFRDAAAGRMDVLFGMEIRFPQNSNDYLVYGFDEAFLFAHPDIMQMDVKSFSALARENGLLFYQAHPFRDGITVVNPAYLDGMETYNGHPRHEARNDIAKAWAEKYGLLQIGGSDFHEPDAYGTAGILTDRRITNNEELLAVLRSQPQIYRGECRKG